MRNETLEAWILLVAAQTCPARIHWCDGSQAELEELRERSLADGSLQALNEQTYPGCVLQRTGPDDALRAEEQRFVCAPRPEDAGPTNRWLAVEQAYQRVWPLFSRAMSGRTLFVVPYLLGSPRSKYAQVGVQLTDSPVVVLLMALLTRVGRVAIDHLGRSGDFARGLHCLGDLRAERRYQVLFPALQTCWSIGTAYPESAAFFKAHVLSLVGALAPEEGYLAEHMAVARITDPSGTRRYVAAAFPSGCGKTRLALMVPRLPGWEVEMVADGTCLLRVGEDGRLWAVNPAAGIDSMVGNSNRSTDAGTWSALAQEAIFSNVGLQSDGSPWWEGSADAPGAGLRDWQGRLWEPGTASPAAHPNARFITAAHHCSSLSSEFYDPHGVPLCAILFGGRRRALAPLIFEATSWEHGVYVAATLRSESRASAAESSAVLRNDPMAMLPFCSYDMAAYFRHWLSLGRQLQRPPRIFHVNWFRADERGRLLWPGFGDNVRVLQWVLDRVERRVDALATPIGFVPRSIDTAGLDLDSETLDQLLQVDVRGWLQEAGANQAFLKRFGERLPRELQREQEALVQRLRAALN